MKFSFSIVCLIFIFTLLVSCLDEKAGKKHFGPETTLISGRVVAVADGDTLTIIDRNKTEHRIRSAGIDTPEKSQPFGKHAKTELSKKVFGKTVNIEIIDIDRYKRLIGNVQLKNRWINRDWGIHLTGAIRRRFPSPRALRRRQVHARQMSPRSRRLWRHIVGLACDDQILVPHGCVDSGKLQHSVEQHAAAA